uniref:Uncharacterized protein n=1 Tax=Anguilla anguilla TaxID=7936 RepID=A0A0E9PW59_ANGAN
MLARFNPVFKRLYCLPNLPNYTFTITAYYVPKTIKL